MLRGGQTSRRTNMHCNFRVLRKTKWNKGTESKRKVDGQEKTLKRCAPNCNNSSATPVREQVP